MRALTRIILHCTATEQGKDYDANTIRAWHVKRGWKDIGYHYVIRLDGSIELGRPIDQPGSHVKGHNSDTIGVVYVGGLVNGKPADTMNLEQNNALVNLVKAIRVTFNQKLPLHGHNEYDKGKACPSFNVQTKYENLNQ
jgi:N-acetylmuramoyl-L-alanine amidase